LRGYHVPNAQNFPARDAGSAMKGVRGGGGADKFRIKIWDKVNSNIIVYDNQLGVSDDSNPTTTLGGGSIVIHTNTK
jgi:hypothetical protein